MYSVYRGLLSGVSHRLALLETGGDLTVNKRSLWIIAVALLLGVTVAATGLTTTGAGRSGGLIIGEEVCRDLGPLVDPLRSDCPGKIVCPISGELVCRDECPLGDARATAGELPACCRGKE